MGDTHTRRGIYEFFLLVKMWKGLAGNGHHSVLAQIQRGESRQRYEWLILYHIDLYMKTKS